MSACIQCNNSFAIIAKQQIATAPTNNATLAFNAIRLKLRWKRKWREIEWTIVLNRNVSISANIRRKTQLILKLLIKCIAIFYYDIGNSFPKGSIVCLRGLKIQGWFIFSNIF